MPSGPTTSRTSKQSASGGRQLILLIAVGGLLLLGLLFYSTIYFGFVEGQEFAADTFNRRQFSFYEIPMIGVQVSPISRQDVTNDLEAFLSAEKLTPPAKNQASKRWDLVRAERGLNPSSRQLISQGEARILCEYLDAEDNKGSSLWLAWTKEHLELAKVVWPAVAKVAQQELYVLAPELLICARNATDPAALKQDLDQLLADRYLSLAKVQQGIGNHAAAVELFTEVLVHDPKQTEALTGRAKSLTQLGKSEAASADIAKAKDLDERT